MSGCNATLTVYVESPHDAAVQWAEQLTCDLSRSEHDVNGTHEAEDGFVLWTDDAPGAKPHTPPCRFRAVERSAGARAVVKGYETIAYYSGYGHPAPDLAAEAEADRLNGVRR